jgi:hypothetical protein
VRRNNILVYKSQQDAHQATEFILSDKQIKQAQQSGTTKYADRSCQIK